MGADDDDPKLNMKRGHGQKQQQQQQPIRKELSWETGQWVSLFRAAHYKTSIPQAVMYSDREGPLLWSLHGNRTDAKTQQQQQRVNGNTPRHATVDTSPVRLYIVTDATQEYWVVFVNHHLLCEWMFKKHSKK